MFNFFKKQPGFSIIEVIAVIFIIAVGLTGILSLIVQNIQAQYINKNALIASQLAQEGLELIRNVRDENWLATPAIWAFSSIAEEDGSKLFAIDFDGMTSVDSSSLKIDTDYYLHSGSADSGFSRIIQTENNHLASSTVVSCIVEWKEKKGGEHKYVAETVLYDWR
ncbi:MAG: prepilin-type N-terminal cleavage/methylation domain-containing protein [Patescibacteria group bacterium]|nr:prepilin-type N-terminal cleavage/methylation domain-containing protein [Patescibacteria group bacterium]